MSPKKKLQLCCSVILASLFLTVIGAACAVFISSDWDRRFAGGSWAYSESGEKFWTFDQMACEDAKPDKCVMAKVAPALYVASTTKQFTGCSATTKIQTVAVQVIGRTNPNPVYQPAETIQKGAVVAPFSNGPEWTDVFLFLDYTGNLESPVNHARIGKMVTMKTADLEFECS